MRVADREAMSQSLVLSTLSALTLLLGLLLLLGHMPGAS